MSEAPRRLVAIGDLTLAEAGRSVLRGVSLNVDAGETVVLLGEAGSGAAALVRALVQPPRGAGRSIALHTARIAWLANPLARPLSPLGPVLPQLVRVVARRLATTRAGAKTDFKLQLERFAHAPRFVAFEQRLSRLTPETVAWGLLAAAVAQNPELLIADNAFAGLAPAQTGLLMRALLDEQKRLGFAILAAAITADTARGLGGRIIVMRDGRFVEEGSVTTLSGPEAQSYSRHFFKPMSMPAARMTGRGEPVLQAYGLELAHRTKKRRGKPLNFELRRGTALALLGDEGSGRRALVRALLGLERAEKGRVILDAVDIGVLSAPMLLRLRRRVGYISGDDALLDPRMTVWHTVEEPLRAHLNLRGDNIANYRDAALKRVGLDTLPGNRAVAALAPFDKRRLQIARAIVAAPLLVVADEPWHGLDTVAQGVVRDLLRNFRAQEGAAFLVVTADIRVAEALADEALVVRDRAVIERGTVSALIRAPKEAYTRGFVEASRYPVSGLSSGPKQG
jgi:peptide/nickel transport system ATP-binding protein